LKNSFIPLSMRDGEVAQAGEEVGDHEHHEGLGMVAKQCKWWHVDP
jgi:hypothetical protein